MKIIYRYQQRVVEMYYLGQNINISAIKNPQYCGLRTCNKTTLSKVLFCVFSILNDYKVYLY